MYETQCTYVDSTPSVLRSNCGMDTVHCPLSSNYVTMYEVHSTMYPYNVRLTRYVHSYSTCVTQRHSARANHKKTLWDLGRG